MATGDHQEQIELISRSMIETIKKEIVAGRHPQIKVQYSGDPKIYNVTVSSEQIIEHLEFNPSGLEAFKSLLKQNGLTGLL
jgi:hypothetical protein